MSRFVTRRQVEFSDTDMAGLVHFSRYYVYMETAEHKFLASRGVEVNSHIGGNLVSWPRVATELEYHSPAHYGDHLDIEVRVLRRGTKSVTYGFHMRRDNISVARGKMTAVCCQVDPKKGVLKSVPIPDDLARKIGDPDPDDA